MSQTNYELNTFSYKLPQHLERAVLQEIEDWRRSKKITSVWDKDSSVWTRSGEEEWMGWIDIVSRQMNRISELEAFALSIRREAYGHVVLLGMGGSSLCAEVIQKSFGSSGVKLGFPDFHILDSTDPIQIRDIEELISIEDTLFIVSSKSGSTLEPNILCDYFFQRMKECVGNSDAGSHFIAITDPGSNLEARANNSKFLKVFHGDPSIGGRYSVLSHFGMVPAALMGVDIKRFLNQTQFMVEHCRPDILSSRNPGVILGAILGTLGRIGHDKVTIACTPETEGFGAWVEQLLAESTGKQGHGLIPIVGEETLLPEFYGSDRVFVYVRMSESSDAKLDLKINALEQAGQPVIRITIADIYNLGQEFFRWELSTAVAGSILGINPFDQPDVEASKVATRKLTDQYEKDGSLQIEAPIFQNDDVQVFGDPIAFENEGKFRNLQASDYLCSHLNRLGLGDYFAILAYVPMSPLDDKTLQIFRTQILKSKKVATCVEFGPRFLHSTGQAYKGGPNSGVFLQITSHPFSDIYVPGHKYTFGVVDAAEAQGDLTVLKERHRRFMRIHLRRDTESGLNYLRKEMESAIRKCG